VAPDLGIGTAQRAVAYASDRLGVRELETDLAHNGLMTGDVDAAVGAACRELIESSASLFAVQQFYGNKVREQTIKAYGRLRDAHLLIMACLAFQPVAVGKNSVGL
jgi:hypothetical protein